MLRRIPMQDADVSYAESLPLSETPEELLRYLIDQIPWRSESIVLWGRKYQQPRLIAWYGDPGASYTYSGITLNPLPWNEALNRVKRSVERFTGFKFNSVLANYYRDHRDSMGFHSDNEPELGTQPVIASVSLGEERTLVMRHKIRKELSPVKLPLASGSILLMKGTTQSYWVHGIPKESLACGPRINLTFRRIPEAASDGAPGRRPIELKGGVE
jgi:alkylated DNA repair dioxygenase AlkB